MSNYTQSPSHMPCLHFQVASTSAKGFRPIKPRRKEAPQHPPAPTKPSPRTAAAFAVPPPPQPRPQPTQPTAPAKQEDEWAQQIDMANLPPLPAGMTIGHLSQYGAAGLEMAIRIGMSIGQQQSPGPQHAPLQQQQMPQRSTLSSIGSTPNASSPEASVSIPQRQRSGGNVVSEILNDDFLRIRSPLSTSPISAGFPPMMATGRRPSQSGEPSSPAPLPEVSSAEEMAKKDPLAAQVWKAYARAKNTLPHGQRMENLTWRMMHLTMKKKEEQEAAAAAAAASATTPKAHQSVDDITISYSSSSLPSIPEPFAAPSEPAPQEERGRTKAKSRVVGFSAGNRDSR